MGDELSEVVQWLEKIPIPVSDAVNARLSEEDVEVQAIRGSCDAQLSELGFLNMGQRSKIISAAAASAVVVPPAVVVVADPVDAAVTGVEARHRRSAGGRAVFAPTFVTR
jgi:hypothetical protein